MPKRIVDKGGRPAFEPTSANRLMVRKLASMGWSHDKIAEGIGCSDETLRKYFRWELDMGNVEMCARIEATLLDIATNAQHKSCVAAATVLLKAKGGVEYRETRRTEITGADGGPVQSEVRSDVIDSRNLAPDDRDALRRILENATGVSDEEAEAFREEEDGEE